jgi:hypothetical protein
VKLMVEFFRRRDLGKHGRYLEKPTYGRISL